MTSRETIIETRNLSKHFGGLAAVDDVSIKIKAGTLHSIIGPNGAGKTTFFNLLSGNLKPTNGKVFYKGLDLVGKPIHQMIHMGIGRSFQITNIFPNLTVYENIRLASQVMEDKNFRFLMDTSKMKQVERRTAEVIARVGLDGQALLPARMLSHGDQRKLELGMILAPDPELLLLDEPTAGMATDQVPELISLIQEVQQSGSKTVILVEHNMNVVMQVSDEITVMHQGKVLAQGTPSEIAGNLDVQTVYLGGLYDLHS